MKTLNADSDCPGGSPGRRGDDSSRPGHTAGSPQESVLPGTEVVELLNTLLEGERAGARALRELVHDSSDRRVVELLVAIGRDEADSCAMLIRQLKRLGAAPSQAVGRFYDRFKKCESFVDKMTLLDRGQGQVVRMLDRLLAGTDDPALHNDLARMRDVHVRNIVRAAEFTRRIAG